MGALGKGQPRALEGPERGTSRNTVQQERTVYSHVTEEELNMAGSEGL